MTYAVPLSSSHFIFTNTVDKLAVHLTAGDVTCVNDTLLINLNLLTP